MPTYVGFLRAINLGATRKFPQAALIAAVEGAGFTAVATHLNTGNVRFDTAMRSRARIEASLEAAFARAAGFDIPTIVMTPAELARIAAAAGELDHHGTHYVALLKTEPAAATVDGLNAAARPGERAVATGRGVHLLLGADFHTAKLPTALERHLGVATNRNLNVIRTVLDKWA